jgi:hypothetical protein
VTVFFFTFSSKPQKKIKIKKTKKNKQKKTSGTQQVEFRDKRPPEKTPRMVVSKYSGEAFDLPDY